MLACAIILLSQKLDRDPFLAVSYSGYAEARNSKKFAASAEPDGSVRVWNLIPGSHKMRFYDAVYPPPQEPDPQDPTAVQFTEDVSPDGKRLLVSTKKAFLIYKLKPARLEKSLVIKQTGWPKWTTDSKHFIVQDGDHALICDVDNNRTRTLPLLEPYQFSRDNRFVLGKTKFGVALYNFESGKQIQKFEESLETGVPFDLSPDGRWVVTSGEDPDWHEPQPVDDMPLTEAAYMHVGTIKLWNVSSGKRIRLWPGFSSAYEQQVFFLDNHRVIVPSNGEVFDISSDKVLKKFKEVFVPEYGGRTIFPIDRKDPYHQNWGVLPSGAAVGYAVAFSGDGRLAVGTIGEGNDWNRSDQLSVWSLKDLTLLKTLHGAPGEAQEIAFLQDGTMIESSGNGVRLFTSDLKQVPMPAAPKVPDAFGEVDMRDVHFLPDNVHGLSRPMMGTTMAVYELATGKIVKNLPSVGMGGEFRPGTWQMLSAARMPGHKGMSLVLHEPETRRIIWENTDFSRLGHYCFSNNGDLIAGFAYPDDASKDKRDTLFIIDPKSGTVLAKTLTAEIPHTVILSADGKRLLLRSASHLELYDTATMQLLAQRPFKFDLNIGCLAFSPDGNTIAAGSHRQFLKLLDARNLETVSTLIPFDDGNWLSVDRTGRMKGTPTALAKVIRSPN